jgi:Cytochrome P450
VLGNGYAYHLDEKYFPNPREFKPERFLDETNPPNEIMPFGIGYLLSLLVLAVYLFIFFPPQLEDMSRETHSKR